MVGCNYNIWSLNKICIGDISVSADVFISVRSFVTTNYLKLYGMYYRKCMELIGC